MNDVLKEYQRLIESRDIDIESVGTEKHPFPSFSHHIYKELCKSAYDHFEAQSPVLRLPADIYVVGDLHGNIRDLIRILSNAGPPPANKFLFLGDYVDRGEYSLEVISLLFALVLKYPENVFLLRGNHEYAEINEVYGFKEQVMSITGSETLWKSFNSAFEQLPVAAIIDDQIFCVHGGLSPSLLDVSGLTQKKCDFIEDLMWSDPSTTTKGFFPSTRGHGYFFGEVAIRNFLKRNNLKQIVRAHQCIKKGVSLFGNDSCVTVFSTCNYDGKDSNECGIIKYDQECVFHAYNFETIKILPRSEAKFKVIPSEYSVRPILSLNSININCGKVTQAVQAKSRLIKRGKIFRKSCFIAHSNGILVSGKSSRSDVY